MRRKEDAGKGPIEHALLEAHFWDDRGIGLDTLELPEEPLTLGGSLQREILSGKRRRKLKNLTIKINPDYVVAIKKIATRKALPYQSLIRQWLSQHIKEELHL